ncbi:MAG: galactokinase [Phycisphaerales bacterium]|nr:galactokinase [Phycisphaerae bacterium]NNF41996.1 galactokinase [Phycisphaerales bacterium]NNM27187.1 galactokinase [Phycisphaerales bacterium]
MSEPETPDRATLAERARQSFATRFGRPATTVVAAPGRVNLIGDHTDYEEGLALPMAIDRSVVIAAAPRETPGDTACRIHSVAMNETCVVRRDDLVNTPPPAGRGWKRYVAGVLALAPDAGMSAPAFDAWIESTVPPDAGLSSSAALEVAVATLVESLVGRTLPPLEKARWCQRAEHVYAGVPCGLMDQIASAASTAGHAMLLDCRTLAMTPIPLPAREVAVLLADTGERRDLTSSAYAERRQACRDAATHLGVATLRDAERVDLDRVADVLPPAVLRRACHVIGENDRVRACAAALRCGHWSDAGRLMNESHDSLRDDFEVSSAALDAIVAAARSIGSGGGVHGARMTGAGMGGCVVILAAPEAASGVMRRLTRIASSVLVVRPEDGAGPVCGG